MVSVGQELNFTRQFRANIFEECKFICNLLLINNRSVFFEKFSVHFFWMTFLYLALSRACIILLVLILLFLRETIVTEQTNQLLKSWHIHFLTALDVLVLLYSIVCKLILSNSMEFLIIMHLKRYSNYSLGSKSIEKSVKQKMVGDVGLNNPCLKFVVYDSIC